MNRSSRVLPLRADPRWGLFISQPLMIGLPVGTGQSADVDPTRDWGWEPPVIVPPLPDPDPIASSSEESSSEESSEESSTFESSSDYLSSSDDPSSSSEDDESSSDQSVSVTDGGPDCCVDDVSSRAYSFTIGGGSNVGCSVCSAFNGSWVVTHHGLTGTWRSAPFIACPYGISDNEWRWTMSMQCLADPPRLRVTVTADPFHFPATTVVTYRADFSLPHNCLSAMVLSKLTEPGDKCSGFGGTISVTAS